MPLVLGLLWGQFRVKHQASRLRLPPAGAASVREPARKIRALLGSAVYGADSRFDRPGRQL